MLLYDMLTGRPAICGENAFETLHRQVTEAFAPPSSLVAEIDERLDSLVMQAIAKSPQARFPTAASMENALYLYLNPEPAAAPPRSERRQAGHAAVPAAPHAPQVATFPALSR